MYPSYGFPLTEHWIYYALNNLRNNSKNVRVECWKKKILPATTSVIINRQYAFEKFVENSLFVNRSASLLHHHSADQFQWTIYEYYFRICICLIYLVESWQLKAKSRTPKVIFRLLSNVTINLLAQMSQFFSFHFLHIFWFVESYSIQNRS